MQDCWIAAEGADYSLIVLNTFDESQQVELNGHTAQITDVSWNLDSSILLSVDATGVMNAWKRCF